MGIRKLLLERSHGMHVMEPSLKLRPPEFSISAFINKCHVLSRSSEKDNLESQKANGMSLPGNIYTKKITFTLVVRREQMAR